MDCNLPGSSVHGDSPGKNTWVGCHSLLQGIFPTQGSNWGLLHCSSFFTVWATMEANRCWQMLPTWLLSNSTPNWELVVKHLPIHHLRAGLPLIQVLITSFCLFCFFLFFVLVALGLSCLMACGILAPRPGIEPAFPALENRFLTIGPLEKCLH